MTLRHSRTRKTAIAFVAFAFAVLGGCQSAPSRWPQGVQKEIEANLERAERESAPVEERVPAEVSEALLPPIRISVPEGGTAPLEERFDLVVDDAPVRQVFMGLVEGTDYSIVVHPDVAGSISLNLKNVTLTEALNTIRDVYGYEYRREGNRFLILSPGLHTRIFRVNYLNLSRKGASDTRVSSKELTRATQISRGVTGTTPTQTRTTVQIPSIKVETTSEADFWKELKATLKGLIGEEEGRRVVVNPQAGLVVVRAHPQELRLVEELLGVTHEALNRQVILEAKILEVERRDGFQSGINWSRLHLGRGTAEDPTYTLGQVGGGTSIETGRSEIAGQAGDLDPSAYVPIAGTLASAFGGVFTLAVETTNFSAFIELLKTQGKVHVLSSPRVSTVNNQKAVIKVGGDQFFITGVTGSVTTPVDTTTAPTVELTPFFSGIALDVTPQIDEADNIILHIHPSVSEVTQRTQSFVIGDEAFNLPLAVSTIQESDSIVRARSGQIIVIGGLMKEAATGDEASVPLLADVPIFGNLFKHKKVTRIKKELIILLKPTIVQNGRVWRAAIRESRDRIKGYERRRHFMNIK